MNKQENNLPPSSSTHKDQPNSNKKEFEVPKKKLNTKPKNTIPVVDASEVIHFRIVHNEEEFKKFTSGDLEYSFNPYFTHQIFQDDKITGYKNLKILISLTPRLLYPHFKITYDSISTLRDDIELLLKEHFGHVYETNDEAFMKKLKEDTGKPTGEVIRTEDDIEVFTSVNY
jgi:hypothetical protein